MAADNDNAPLANRTAKCANCGKPVVAEYRPFCSPRCKDLDLSRWLRGVYAIPAGNDDEDGERPTGDAQNSGRDSNTGVGED